MNRWTVWLSRGAFFAALFVAIPGCDPYGAYCDEKMDCEDGNEMDVESCVVDLEEEEERASLWDCDEYFDIYFECLELESECESDHYIVDGNNCNSEAEDLDSCM